jgi:hypothetical protein
MRLLTWHGTIIRVEPDGKRIHAPLWPARDVAVDLDLDISDERFSAPLLLPGDIAVIAAADRRCVHIRQGARYLSADPARGEVTFMRDIARQKETFLPLSDAELADLRDIVSHGWIIAETGEDFAPGAVWPSEDFGLAVGAARIDLRHGVPRLDDSGDVRLALTRDGALLHMRRGVAAAARDELALRRRPFDDAPLPDRAAFASCAEGSIMLQGDIEYGFLPLTAHARDQDWMHARFWRPQGPRLGPYQPEVRLVRERDKYVLLTRWQEGLVFDARGARTETGFLLNQRVTERGVLLREGDMMFIDRAALDAAPYLPGCYAVIGNGNLSSYYHWVMDALLPLFIMRPYLPAGTRLLVPGTIGALRGQPGIVDHMAALRAWGFADLEAVEMPPPLCRLEEAVWLDHFDSYAVPADLLAAARAHVLARMPPRDAARRVYVRQRGAPAVLNEDELVQTLQPLGFETHEMEALSPAEQISLFRDAEDVVAVHGAALTNLIYAAAGTRVLELMPDPEYRSAYAEISDKLGLAHGVLPCPTDDGQFVGNVSVDIGAMRRLLSQLQTRT